ncbi:MAG: Wadjet anti-phage system protein JetA family protein [Anaerolineales bacterium]|jgi:Family of unknown function (DUF5716)
MTNPFDILPPNIFNLFATQGQSTLQRHYIAILLRIYALAEFNRSGITREVAFAEIVDYLKEANAEAEVAADMTNHASDEPDSISTANQKSEQDTAGFVIRRLAETGWIEREQHADYSETIILPDYAFTLLEAMRTIQEQKPREFTGQLYAAHQLMMSSHTKDFSAALAVTQTYENVRQVARGLSELNHNIRRYVERATKQTYVAELLRMQFNDYSHTLGPAYHALKTSDHVSRYRRDIVNQAQKWLYNEKWLQQAAEELALQSRFSPAQAKQEIAYRLDFIVNQLDGLDPLIEDIDERHAQYLRTSLRQVRYQLSSADGNFKDRLVSLAQQLSALRLDGMIELPEDSPQLRQFPVKIPDMHSFYTPPQKRAPFVPNNIFSTILAPSDLALLRADTMRDVTQAFSPDKVNRKVLSLFGKSQHLPVTQFPDDIRDDLHWLTTIIAYAHHPDVEYGLEITPGNAVALGGYRVVPFELIKL